VAENRRCLLVKRIHKLLGIIGVLLLVSTLVFISSCAENGSPSDAKIKFTFHSGCPSVEVKVYLDNEYTDLIYTDGSYEYHVDPGAVSYLIRRSSDNEVIWSGQVNIPEGMIQGVTLTCS